MERRTTSIASTSPSLIPPGRGRVSGSEASESAIPTSSLLTTTTSTSIQVVQPTNVPIHSVTPVPVHSEPNPVTDIGGRIFMQFPEETNKRSVADKNKERYRWKIGWIPRILDGEELSDSSESSSSSSSESSSTENDEFTI